MKRAICPACWHAETIEALRAGREVLHDDVTTMEWQKPYGDLHGQTVAFGGGGFWRCRVCGLVLEPQTAMVLIDAVLRVSDPNSDSYDEELGTFLDAIEAANGGENQ